MSGVGLDVVLLGTSGCHLCELARDQWLQWLSAAGPLAERICWREQDIADSDALVARYGIRIPVLRLVGQDAELGWPFDAAAINGFINANIRS